MRPLDALAQFLRALGVPAETIPTELDDAAAMYRSMLAGKRVLVLLDNARSADQVRPLLPASPGCLFLVTSRDQLDQLDQLGGGRVNLDVLAADEARDLLVRVLGQDRISAEPDAADELARLCAYLPLALRIAAANLADGEAIAGYVDRLAAGNRLASLEVEGDRQAAVRAAFDLSYAALPEPDRRMFRLFGLVPGLEFTAASAAALAGLTEPDAAAVLTRLASVHLVEPVGGRFGFHDLLRLYAAENLARDAQRVRDAAVHRLYRHYLDRVNAAARLLHPEKLQLPTAVSHGFEWSDSNHAEDWLDTERANLLAAVAHAVASGVPAMAWSLLSALRSYFLSRRHLTDWLACSVAALRAATAAGDPMGEAVARLSRGDAYWRSSRPRAAFDEYEQAVLAARRAGWAECEATALTNMGALQWQAGRLGLAADRVAEALVLNRRTNWLAGQFTNLSNLGLMYGQLGRLTAAAGHIEQALAVSRKIGARGAEGTVRGNLGEICHLSGRFDDALLHLGRAIEFHREHRSAGAIDVLCCLAAVYRDLGRFDECAVRLNEARIAADRAGEQRLAADVLNGLGALSAVTGDPDAAIGYHDQAYTVATDSGDRYPQTHALVGLAGAHRSLGRYADAVGYAERAIAMTTDAGFRILDGRARAALADARLAGGEPQLAVEFAGQALAIHRETGHRPGEARALRVLGNALAATGRERAAEAAWHEAFALFTDMGMPEAGELAHQVRSSVARLEQRP
jgi:tetratricopeptide (TPR) repeat protein